MGKIKRIIGYDFARGLAIIGMVFVNFKVVMVQETDAFLYQLVDLLSGKAAALFVMLAGVGITLMYNSAKRKNDLGKIRQVKTNLLKRATFLFVVGLSYYFIWPADILHYYGLYLTVGVVLLAVPKRWLLIISGLLIIGYSVSLLFFNYETGWNFTTLEYTDFFTINGFFRNLFFNGFHPVFPWVAFLLIGIWVGRIDFNNTKKRNIFAISSLIVFIVFKTISILLVGLSNTLSPKEAEELYYLFGTSPMPPMFFYMITASSLSIFIIAISVFIGQKFSNTLFVKHVVSAGQLALSNYFFHIIIGMLGILLIFGKLEQAFSIEFVFFYALFFNILLIIFSHLWRKKFKRGPLELLMRKITG